MLKHREVDYDERAIFYSQEVDLYGFEQFCTYLGKKNPKILIDMPCGDGAKIPFLSDSTIELILIDNNENMLNEAQKKIKNHNIKNCKLYLGDIRDTVPLDNADIVLLLQYAAQFFDKGKLQTILKAMSVKTQTLFIEFQDYEFNKHINSGKYHTEREIYVEDEIIEKKVKYTLDKNKVYLSLLYLNDKKQGCMDIQLYNYKFGELLRIFKAADFIVENVYSDYNLSSYNNNNSRMIF